MKKTFLSLLIYFTFSYSYSSEIKLIKIFDGLNKPWSLSVIDENNILITEKSGNLLIVNLKDKTKSVIKHNLSVLEDGQGGLLDILYKNNNVWVGYSEDHGKYKSITSIAKAKFNLNQLNFKNMKLLILDQKPLFYENLILRD